MATFGLDASLLSKAGTLLLDPFVNALNICKQTLTSNDVTLSTNGKVHPS